MCLLYFKHKQLHDQSNTETQTINVIKVAIGLDYRFLILILLNHYMLVEAKKMHLKTHWFIYKQR